jgi:hypothetical protein
MAKFKITPQTGLIICHACLGITRKKADVVCHNLPPESPVEGLLGLDFFKGCRITLDLRKNTLEVNK